ncbi:hypothetical protein ACIBL3_00295 [Kribbella sp. NPDC050124]|uniref:hypothetical protein n=1 Tax=Kribbella sp. NPDC050124 TaxID=3364114 RepID=UPI0037B5E650
MQSLELWGGWDNLLQGLVSTGVGAILAAATAWLILLGTKRHERALENELSARTAARELDAAIGDLSIEIGHAIKQRDALSLDVARLRVIRMMGLGLAEIEVVDPEFVEKRLRPFLVALAGDVQAVRAGDWSDERRQALVANLANTHDLLSGWVARRATRRERRSFTVARNRDGTRVLPLQPDRYGKTESTQGQGPTDETAKARPTSN